MHLGRLHARAVSVAVLGLLVLTPGATAWGLALDAPADVGAGVPFLVEVCAAGPPGAPVQFKVAWLVDGRPAGQVTQSGHVDSGHRYGPATLLDAEGRGCRTVRVDPPPAPSQARLEVKVRPEGGAAKATLTANVTAHDVPVARVSAQQRVSVQSLGLRLPVDSGGAFVPLLLGISAVRVDGVDGAPPSPLDWRFVEARRGALGGFVLTNGGGAPASLEGLVLTNGRDLFSLPAIAFAPGARVLVGPSAAPDVPNHIAASLDAAAGEWMLAAGQHVLDRIQVPPLAKGEFIAASGTLGIQGRTNLSLAPLAVEGRMEVYTTPSAGASPLLHLLDGATRSIRGELYTLTSPEIAHALAAAAARGIETTLLLEGAPAGGIPPDEEALVATLVAHGAHISWLSSAPDFPARFRTLHAKVLVIDDAIVHLATENPTPHSYPPQGRERGTRGVGVIIHNESLAQKFAAILDADLAAWPDVEPARLDWLPPAVILERAPVVAGPSLILEGRWNVTPIVSPDMSLDAAGLLARLAAAREQVDVAMLLADARFPDGGNPFLDALVVAAREGARVRLLLDGRFERGEHEAILERLQQLAEREGLALEVRFATPEETLHAKWVAIDHAMTYIGSMNWGHAAATKNREVGLLVENETVARWTGTWFEEEWEKSEKGRGALDATNEVAAPSAWWVLIGLSFLLPRRATRARSRRRT